MKKLFALLLVILIISGLSGCVVKLPEPQDISSADEAEIMGFSAGSFEEKLEVGDYQRMDVNIKIDYEYALWWSSSNDKVATVDSGGRVDGLKPGKVTITAHAKKASIDFDLEVVKGTKNREVSYSTAFTDNDEILSANKSSANDRALYALLVNSATNCLTVYTYNAGGIYNVAVRSMVCSVSSDYKTIIDTNINSDRQEWHQSGDSFFKYATYFGDDLILCSTPYSDMSSSSLVRDDYNKLGEAHKGDKIWLSVSDAKWIYDNCESGTRLLLKVQNQGRDPLGVPNAMKLSDNAPNKNWDPTDMHSENPYNKLKPTISGADDVTIKVGGTLGLFNGVLAYDTCMNPNEKDIKVDGTIGTENEGVYIISYYYTDDLGRTERVDRVVTVE